MLARIQLASEMVRIEDESLKVGQKLKRLGKACVDRLYGDEDYKREKRSLEEQKASLVIPGIDVAKEAGKLLEDLPTLWQEANLTERRTLLTSMLDAVYVDAVEEKAIVAIRPKPAFQPLFEIATTRAGSGMALINGTPQTQDGPEASGSCFWWRRGRDGLHQPVNLAAALRGWKALPAGWRVRFAGNHYLAGEEWGGGPIRLA